MTLPSSPKSSLTLPTAPIIAVTIVAWIFMAVAFQAIPQHALASYLMAFMFFLAVSLGSMGLLMMQYLTGGSWGLVIRRPAEAAAMSLLVLIPLFLPVVIGVKHLYLWADPAAVASDNILQHRAIYMNFYGWLARAAVYFLIWLALIIVLRRLSLAHDDSGSPAVYASLKRISAAGLVIYVVTMSLAGVDWIMSRDAHWYSTIFGFMLVVGQALTAMAVLVIVLAVLSRRAPLQKALQPQTLNDFGNLFLTLVILWAYMSFSQFLVSWMGNISLDAQWYVPRIHGGIGAIGGVLITFHFFVPFLLLLSRDAKRKIAFLCRIAILIIVMRWLDLFWIIRPTLVGGPAVDPASGERLIDVVRFTDFTAPIAIGGFWFVVFQRLLAGPPLLPQRDPAVTEMLKHGQHAAHTA